MAILCICFFFNDTPPTEIYTLSLHDALPIWGREGERERERERERKRERERDTDRDTEIEREREEIGRAHV